MEGSGDRSTALLWHGPQELAVENSCLISFSWLINQAIDTFSHLSEPIRKFSSWKNVLKLSAQLLIEIRRENLKKKNSRNHQNEIHSRKT